MAVYDLKFHRGEDVLLTVTMVPLTDITGWTISFTMRHAYDINPVLIEKTGAPDIIILNGPLGIFTVKVRSDETANAAANPPDDIEDPDGIYVFDIQRVDAGARSVLDEGTITLQKMVNPVDA